MTVRNKEPLPGSLEDEIKKGLIEAQKKKAMEKSKKEIELYDLEADRIAKKVIKSDEMLSNVELGSWSLDGLFNRIIPTLKTDFAWAFNIASILLIPINIYRAYHAAFVRKETEGVGLANRVINVVSSLANVSLGIIATLITAGTIYIAAPLLLVVGSVKGVIDTFWDLGLVIQQRILNKDESKNAKLNQTIAKKAHSAAIALSFLVGSILFLFPPTAPIGAGILLGTSIYALVDTFQLNPLRYIANKITQKFKTPFTIKETVKEEAEQSQPHPELEKNKQVEIHNSEVGVFKGIKLRPFGKITIKPNDKQATKNDVEKISSPSPLAKAWAKISRSLNKKPSTESQTKKDSKDKPSAEPQIKTDFTDEPSDDSHESFHQ